MRAMPTEAAMLRRWAIQCAAVADEPTTKPEERERLLKMHAALLDLVHAQEWLDGRKPSKPPTQQQQQEQIENPPWCPLS